MVAKDVPGSPVLLQIDAKISPNAYGSPVFDEQGSLIGIYGASVVPQGQDIAAADAAMKDIHFVTIVDRATILRWTENRDEKTWVLPSKVDVSGQTPNGKQ